MLLLESFSLVIVPQENVRRGRRNKAKNFIKNSFYSIKEIPLSFRFSILVARRVYRQIGRNIIKKQTIQNYHKSGKIFVTNNVKILQTLLSIYDLLKLSLIKKHNHLRDKEHELISEEINLNERF